MSAQEASSRAAALALLSGVLGKRRQLDGQLSLLEGLAPRDAGFARALASQTLRHFGQLDTVIRHFAPKPLSPHKAGPAGEILLMGACELLILKVAAHAAVDGANRLAASDAKAVHFKPLINAVLRRVAREGEAVLASTPASLNTPDWLLGRWTAQYGDALAHDIAAAHGREAPLDIVLKNPSATFPESEVLFGLGRRVHDATRIEDMPGFASGDWWVQDAAATLPVALLGDVKGKRVIELCAAPGGKTLQLAAAGAQVVAVERDAMRMKRVAENLGRVGLTAEMVVVDARDYCGRAGLVLLDAPCTATGTIRRHPDLPWIRGAADITAASAAAYEILQNAANMVEPGGILVFAVCSLEREEGKEQIAAFLDGNPEFFRVPARAGDVFGHSEWITPEGDLRTLPCHLNDRGGMDGFYAARLRRSETA